jgi:hypothetical protein
MLIALTELVAPRKNKVVPAKRVESFLSVVEVFIRFMSPNQEKLMRNCFLRMFVRN